MMYNDIEPVNMSNVPIIFQLCRLAKIMESVNAIVDWREENSNISPGFLIETLVICILSARKALWKVHEFWSQEDLDFFYPELKIEVGQLNFNAYARALDKLSKVNMEYLVNTICLTMLRVHDLSIETVHLDTTSKSVQGEFEEKAEGKFDINRGYSKDKRPDLKQFKIGAAVQQNGLPIMGNILSGNKDDKEWNPEAVIKMEAFFESKGYRDVIYIGDSATVSSYESLKTLKNINFISRLPETFAINDELRKEAFAENNFIEIGKISEETKASEYKVKSYIRKLDGVEYRFIVVHSSALEHKKIETIEKNIVKTKERLKKKAENLSKKAFACTEDAQRALDEFTSVVKGKHFLFESNIICTEKKKYTGKGRPKAGDECTITTNYYVQCNIVDFDTNEYSNLLEKESTFILITSLKDAEKYSDEAILREYKEQNSIEEAFRFLKNPVYMGAIFLEKKERIEALGYVFILVLLIANYLQYRVRKSLKDNDEHVVDPGNKKNYRPSVKRIFEILEDVIVIITPTGRFFPKNINPRIIKMIEWAGFSSEIYLNSDTTRKNN